ncbi:MAG: dihydrolipoyl dehydrogenase [Flavobacteriales bacterium TMED191]|nr:MAG: dihydrolipoyl dehydrogenase [Flavobacteriales bacterium TMED191]|tara:strand:+ start:2747 stop:4150 length:1404 start_codon:yes stop_codon:yes gene_type:complete
MNEFDVVIIGSGPGGYVAAIRCAQLGMKIAIIEKYPQLGGTCLNVGCIPSKALLESSEHFHKSKHEFKEHGINVGALKIDFSQTLKRKEKIISEMHAGLDFLMKKNKITVFEGTGSFVDKNTVAIVGKQTTQKIHGKNIIIATGSKPLVLPFFNFDKQRIITSTEALSLKEIPRKMIIIGAGVIGLELGSVYARMGSEVSVVDISSSVLSSMDASLGRELKKVLTRDLGFKFYLSHKVEKVTSNGKKVELIASSKSNEKIKLHGDYCLISIGRRPFTDSLNLDSINVETNSSGQIKVNKSLMTSQSNIYAIGDVVEGTMLAHKAEEEGVFVAELIAGQKPEIHHHLIPNVVYTWPEVSSVGFTEEELKKLGRDIKIGTFPFKANGRAKISMDNDGFVKIIADAVNDEILGVHMIGPRCADLISEAVVAMEYKATAEDIARITHAHPTFSEVVKEAALAATENRALHI